MTEQNKKIEEKIKLIKTAIKKKQSRRYLESLKDELLVALKEIRILQAPRLVKGVDYEDGKDGYTPVKGKDYRDGDDGYTPVKGKDYFDGKDGYTPVRGVDYYTQYDIDILVDALKLSDKEISAIKEAVRPIKGKDYDDGKDAYTPVKGKDYFTEAEVKSIIDLATSGFKITTKQVVKLLSDPKQKYEDRLSVLMLRDLNKLNFASSGGESGKAIEGTAPSVTQYGYLRFTVGNGDNVITAGTKNYVAQIPYAGTITGWYISETSSTPVTGSIVVDVWKDTSGNYPPTVSDTIAGTEKPTLSSAKLNSDTTLTTWTTSVSVGDCIGFTVDSNTDCKRVTVLLTILKS